MRLAGEINGTGSIAEIVQEWEIAPGRFYRRAGKRLFDVVTVALAVIPVLPLLLLITLAVAADGGRPFYSQARVGRNGRQFGCLKFRSMVPDAESRLEGILARDPAAATEWAGSQKLQDDPRVTRLGRYLRKTSLDELPQLWNVLRGDMSLVGPRPVVPEELARYGKDAATYALVRPGITGAWQAAGRNATTYDERVALDVDYVRNISFRRDLKVILRTFIAVLDGTGM